MQYVLAVLDQLLAGAQRLQGTNAPPDFSCVIKPDAQFMQDLNSFID